MTTYFFPDAEERGVAKTISKHCEQPLEDREVFALMLQYNATTVEVRLNTSGAPRMSGGPR